MGSDHQQSEPNIYVVNSSSMSMDQPLSSVTTTTSVLPDVTGKQVQKDYIHGSLLAWFTV